MKTRTEWSARDVRFVESDDAQAILKLCAAGVPENGNASVHDVLRLVRLGCLNNQGTTQLGRRVIHR